MKAITVAGAVGLVIGFGLLGGIAISYFHRITVSSGSFKAIVTDRNPVFRYDIGMLGQNDEVHVKCDCSSGGFTIGIIREDAWNKLVREGKLGDPDSVKRNSDATIQKPLETKTMVVTKDKEAVKTITEVIPASITCNVLTPLGPGPFDIEIIYIMKEVPGTITCDLSYEVWRYPYRGHWLLPTVGCFGIILGSVYLLLKRNP